MKKSATDIQKPPAATTGNLAVVSASTAPETDPFRRLIYDWLDAGKADGLSPRTLKDYHDKLFKFWWWWVDYTRYKEKVGAHPRFVTRKEAREFAAYLREPLAVRWGDPARPGKELLSAASVASYGRSVKVFFSWLETEGYLDTNPFGKGVKFTTRKQDKTVKRVEQADIARLFDHLMDAIRLDSFTGKRNLAIIALLLDSGIRRGELLSMKRKDVDLERNRCLVSGKTGPRYAMFSEACRAALEGYLQARDDQGYSYIPQLWITASGDSLGESGYNVMIQRLKKRTGVSFSGHRLRHTYASALAAQGIDPFMLRDLLGHSNISTTQIYVQQNTDTMAEAYAPRSPLRAMPDVARKLKKRNGRPRRDR